MDIKIGIIGIGEIGRAIIENLHSKNYTLSIFNRTNSKISHYCSKRIIIYDDPYRLINDVNYVLFCLSDDTAINSILNDNKLSQYSYQGKYFIDLSSISEKQAKKNYSICRRLAIQYFDAPISGGVEGTQKGTLSIMVGGDSEHFNEIVFVLKELSKNITYMGKSGSGTVTKLINQIIVGSYLAGIGEAFAFAESIGLDVEHVYTAISEGYAQSNVLDSKLSNYLNDSYDDGGKVILHRKDLLNAIKTAKNNELNLELTKYLIQKFDKLVEFGYENKDHSVLFKLYKKIITGSD